MQAIDQLIVALRSAIPGVHIEQLKTTFPADDAGLWFVTHPEASVEVNIESHDGGFPFLIENSRNDTRVTTTDLEETLTTLRWNLGRYRTQDSPAA